MAWLQVAHRRKIVAQRSRNRQHAVRDGALNWLSNIRLNRWPIDRGRCLSSMAVKQLSRLILFAMVTALDHKSSSANRGAQLQRYRLNKPGIGTEAGASSRAGKRRGVLSVEGLRSRSRRVPERPGPLSKATRSGDFAARRLELPVLQQNRRRRCRVGTIRQAQPRCF